MSPTNHSIPTSEHSKSQVLADCFGLATQFSACVEVFNLIHPSKDTDKAQRVALAKLGIQQGRLLIFGDVVGISSPPSNIARHMVPSKPGATNPDPLLPVNFGERDPRLDEPAINEKVRAALNEISGRPSYLSREELMAKYGLKSPKRFGVLEYPPLDTNRLEAFREKYSLLNDLLRSTGGRPPGRRGTSMTVQHWLIQSVEKFSDFVKTVRTEVDGLIALMGVKEKVDRGMRLDIKSMGWHPDCRGSILRQDYEKLKLIRQACIDDYPEYVEVTEKALSYMTQEMRESGFAMRTVEPTIAASAGNADKKNDSGANGNGKGENEKRPSFLSLFNFRSWSKSSRKVPQATTSNPADPDPKQQRSMSEDLSHIVSRRDEEKALEPVRSQSLSAVPDPNGFDLDSRLDSVPTQDTSQAGSYEPHPLIPATTENGLISRHDMYKGVGRVETHEARAKAKDWALGR